MLNSDVVPVLSMPEWRRRDQIKGTECIAALAAKIKLPIKTLLDIRYGLGHTAATLVEDHPGLRVYGFEIDTPTYQAAWKPQRGEVLLGRYDSPGNLPKHWPRMFDLVIAEFSNVTKHSRQQLDVAVVGLPCRYLIFEDVAVMRLHLHHRTYGFDERCTLEQYSHSFKVEGYASVAWAKAHARASFGLYSTVQKKTPSKSARG